MGKTTTSLRDIVEHPGEFYMILKLIVKAVLARNQIPAGPHWAFCYNLLYRISRAGLVGIQLLDNTDRVRDVTCVFHMVLRALDTVEDDTTIPMEVKIPILTEFHRRIYDPEWHFSCGSKKAYKVLMDGLHHVRAALLELDSSYQQAIEDTTMKMGAGMAKFLSMEIETIDDYDEYCRCSAGLVVIGMSKVFHASGKEDLAPEALANAFGLLAQKMDIIMDYLEDINEKPKPRKFWPREIWSKYANKLEDFKYEENSVKAVQCLNDMVTNALAHVEDSLKFIFTFRDPNLIRLHGIALIIGIGHLALFYNNIQVFRGVVRMRSGLLVKVFNHTKTKSDVYGAVYDFSLMLKSKVDDNDPNAGKTKDILEAILNTCRDSGNLDDQRKSYIIQSKPQYNATLIAVIIFVLAILPAYLFASRPAHELVRHI